MATTKQTQESDNMNNKQMPPWAGYVLALLVGGGGSGAIVGSLGNDPDHSDALPQVQLQVQLCEFKLELIEKELNKCEEK